MGKMAIGKVAKVGVVILVVLAALIAVAVATPHGQTSSTQAGGTTTTTTARTASASGPVSVTVADTAVDQTAADSQGGGTVYIYDVTLSDNDSVSHPSNASYFVLTGVSGAAYSATNASAMQQQLPVETLSPDQEASGQVAFQVQNSDQPTKLEYKIPAQGVDVTVTNLPQPSRWVSSVTKAVATMPSNSATSNYFLTTDIENASTGLYYSTDIIPVKVTVSPYNYDDIVNSDVPTITITSITVSNQGFSVASISPALPVTVSANGNLAEVDITVNVRLPSASVNVQTLDLTLTTT